MKPHHRITIDPSGDAWIRTLRVRPIAVYKDLVFLGLPESKVLTKYKLEPEDLAAVREYILFTIRSRTRDDVTGRSFLPKIALKDGVCYKGRCRNATVARWCQTEDRFYYWREKYGHVFIETIKYPTDE